MLKTSLIHMIMKFTDCEAPHRAILLVIGFETSIEDSTLQLKKSGNHMPRSLKVLSWP